MKFEYRHLLVLTTILGMTSRLHAAQSTQYSLEEQQVLQQVDSVLTVGGYSALGYNQFSLVAKIDTLGSNISSAPLLRLPAATADYPTGTITFPTGPSYSPTWATSSGYNRYQYGDARTTQSGLNAAYGSGTYKFTLGDATAQPKFSLNLVDPVLPVTPLLTSGGTWSGGDAAD
jgi:hypothetical protein